MSTGAQYFCDRAWLGGPAVATDVLVAIDSGRFTAVTPGARRPPGAVHLRGVTLPGMANVHSHAFHRALRGRSERHRGTFWSWREEMYAVAAVLDPDLYYALARAVYAEMALAGCTAVGEFHYLHHGPGGAPYDEPNAMGSALAAAAGEAGIRLTLLDTCYLESAPGRAPEGVQRRFADDGVEAWVERSGSLELGAGSRVGAAIHSVRAVPPGATAVVAHAAAERGAPLHFHLSEQIAENDACADAYGQSPTEVLARAGALGPAATAVHATHLRSRDISLLGASGCGVCMCPTTERDLADGIGPARRLADVGAPVSLGSDSHAVIDTFQEMQGLEHGERLASGIRGRFAADELLVAATAAGHRALGWDDAGRIVVGAIADLVTVSLDSPRLAGADDGFLVEHVVFAATAADVVGVVASGREIVRDGVHLLVDDVAGALRSAIGAVIER